jgi:hypothetical protein
VATRNNAADVDARPACTLKSCPTFNVERYLSQLRQMLPVPPIPVSALKSLHRAILPKTPTESDRSCS